MILTWNQIDNWWNLMRIEEFLYKISYQLEHAMYDK